MVLLTVTEERQTGLEVLREETRYRTASELRNATLADKAGISGVMTGLVTAAGLVTAVALVIAAIVVELEIVAALAIAVV